MNDNIIFSFDKEQYEVGIEAYKNNKDIMLPNGITLQVEKWIETSPPQIDTYKVIAETTSERVIFASKRLEIPSDMRFKINFSFNNEDYEVGIEAYDKNLDIQLPDGKVLAVNQWIESSPPQPEGLHVVENPDYSRTILAENNAKMINFSYESKEYTTTEKINEVQYVELPNDRILQIVIRDPSNKEDPFYFIETIVDVNAEKERGNIITAQLTKPENKLRM